MHEFTDKTEALGRAVLSYAQERMRLDPAPLDGPRSHDELARSVGATITPDGLGSLRALELFADNLALACISTDHPRYLSFIPCAPTQEAQWFDLVVSASSIYGGSWLEGSGAVYAENAALRWIANLAGLPAKSGGMFVQGGTIGNLSALVTARSQVRHEHESAGGTGRPAWRIAATEGAHSSILTAANVMDAEVVEVPFNDRMQMTGERLRAELEAHGPETFFAVVATCGSTNFGIVDDLESVAQVCDEYDLWFHVDGAYGGAGLAAPSVRDLYAGIEHADSFIVDPHKWLFAPFDCCALIYRDPELGRAAHTQKASYLDVLTDAPDWNPSDYSIGLTRRARGLPFWFSLASNGTLAYTTAIEATLATTRFAQQEVTAREYTEVVRPADLSVLVFRRIGWSAADYHAWSEQLLRDQVGFVTPTSHEGETLARFAIVNPLTSQDDIRTILDTMAHPPTGAHTGALGELLPADRGALT